MDKAKRANLQRRLTRWEMGISLWLTRVLACLEYFRGERALRRFRKLIDAHLDAMAKEVMIVILGHAFLGVKLDRRRGFKDPLNRPIGISLRASFGGALRRALKAKTVRGRLEKIRLALQNRAALVARLARRLRNGLTRIAFALTRACILEDCGRVYAPHAAALASADTS